jgi:hypothetical protein
MEKIIYLLWRDPAIGADAIAGTLREAGARHVRLNFDDADVVPAANSRQSVLKPPPNALAQVWVDSAIDQFRKPLDAAIARLSTRHAAYLVTESQPLHNRKHPPERGARTHGFAQVAILRRPERLGVAAWLDTWHNYHTTVAIETQSTFEYVQNVVVRALSADAPAIDAIVEECFPPAAMTDFKTFFDAPGDEAKFKRNLQRMMESVNRFIDQGTIDVIPTSQYDFG